MAGGRAARSGSRYRVASSGSGYGRPFVDVGKGWLYGALMSLPRSVSRPLSGYGAPRRGRLRRRPWWHRVWGLCAVLLGVVAGVLAVEGFIAVPGVVAEERAFLAAVPCTAAEASAARTDCLHTVGATVTGTVIQSSGRQQTYRLRLSGPVPASGSLDMGSAGPLLKRLHPGDRVSVTVWRRYATAVSRDGRTQETNDNPLGDPEIGTALALGWLACGMYAVGVGGWALLGARGAAERGLPALMVPLGKVTVGAAFAACPACLVGVGWGGPVAVVVAWLTMLPLVGWIVLVQVRRARRWPPRGRHTVLRH